MRPDHDKEDVIKRWGPARQFGQERIDCPLCSDYGLVNCVHAETLAEFLNNGRQFVANKPRYAMAVPCSCRRGAVLAKGREGGQYDPQRHCKIETKAALTRDGAEDLLSEWYDNRPTKPNYQGHEEFAAYGADF